MKKRVCIVADVPGWAFDSIAQKIKKDLGKKYDVNIEYFNRRTEADYFYEFIEKNKTYDLIHFLNRRTLLLFDTETLKNKINECGKNVKEYIFEIKNRISTAVYDYMDLDENGIEKLKRIHCEYSKSYYTSTKKLFDIYSSINDFKKPLSMVHDICDNDVFKPTDLNRFEYQNIKDRRIVVGWVGNSSHTGQQEVDLKGFNTIIKPLITELQEEGYNITGYYADRNEKWRNQQEMQNYYNEIDMCLCASIHEGTPRPVLEAMCCGVPIISTDVGIVNEALGPKQKEFVLGDRKNGKNDNKIKEILKQKILELYNNRENFAELSKENLKSINEFDGGKTIKDFENFFDSLLDS